MMNFLDVNIDELGGYCRGQSIDGIRMKIFDGTKVERARLDFFIGGTPFWYGTSDLASLQSDLIYELEKLIDGNDNAFELEGYPFLNLRRVVGDYEMNLTRDDGSILGHRINTAVLMREVVECLKVTDNVLDARRGLSEV